MLGQKKTEDKKEEAAKEPQDLTEGKEIEKKSDPEEDTPSEGDEAPADVPEGEDIEEATLEEQMQNVIHAINSIEERLQAVESFCFKLKNL